VTTLFAVIAAGVVQAASPPPIEADIAWVSRGEYCEPETVLPLPDDTLLISNVCGFSEPGSGFLTLLGADGTVIDWRVVEGLDSPLGMALQGNRLYVIDNNHLKILAWPGYDLQESIELETMVANDVAVSKGGDAYISDTAAGEVIKLSVDGAQSVFIGQEKFPGANGMEIHDGYLYVGGKRLWRVNLQDLDVELAAPEWVSDIDGIEFEADGALQATPVAGPLIRFPEDGNIQILAGEGVSSANHGYAPRLGLALIPTGFDNEVIAIRVAPVPSAAD
jgi:sugar lactone lactonase YvrE